MHKLKTISLGVLVALGSASVVAQNLPAAYEVIDLGALDTVGSADKASFGYAINNNDQSVGSSTGKHTVENEQTNGVVVIEDVNVLQAVDFTDLNRELMPYDRAFGFAETATGMFGTTVDDNGIIAGYGYQSEEIVQIINEAASEDDPADCVESETLVNRTRRTGFFVDLADNLTTIPNELRIGEPLDEQNPEFTSSVILSSNDDYLVGYVSQVTEKDECLNVSKEASRGMYYNWSTEEMTLLTSFEEEGTEDYISSFSAIRAVNQQGVFVGQASAQDSESERRVTRPMLGSIGSTEMTELNALEGSTAANMLDINNVGTYAVGASNFEGFSQTLSAFYNRLDTNEAVKIGFVNDALKYSQAYGVNNDNLVVGTSQATSLPATFVAFIYDIDATEAAPIDLNTMIDCDSGWKLAEARAINDNGWIIGSGAYIDSESGESEVRAFALRPKNTPANQSCGDIQTSDSGGSMGWGLGLLALFGWYRRRF